jgi:Fur family transcriptional regulator, ferric uptake regulator
VATAAAALPGPGGYRGRPGTRSTPRTRALLDVLAQTDVFRTAAELRHAVAERLGPTSMNIGLTTVYRTLAQLVADGRVDTVRDDQRGELRYRLHDPGGPDRYLVCRYCWRSVEIDADPIIEWAADVGGRFGYIDIDVTFNIFGSCDRCQQSLRATQ